MSNLGTLTKFAEDMNVEDAAERTTIEAVTKAIQIGFNAAGYRRTTVKQVADACIIIVTFLKEMEDGPPRSVLEWREAVENLKIALGSKL